MKEYTRIGETQIRLDDFTHDNSVTRYKLATRQKVKNVLVDCDYYEGKSVIGEPSHFGFHITIKVFGKHPYKPNQWYELYSNTPYLKYNYINRCTKTTDHKIDRNSEDDIRLKKVLTFINDNFEQYTKQFINYTINAILHNTKTTQTPQFMLDMINEAKVKMDSQKALNKN